MFRIWSHTTHLTLRLDPYRFVADSSQLTWTRLIREQIFRTTICVKWTKVSNPWVAYYFKIFMLDEWEVQLVCDNSSLQKLPQMFSFMTFVSWSFSFRFSFNLINFTSFYRFLVLHFLSFLHMERADLRSKWWIPHITLDCDSRLGSCITWKV